MTITENLNHPRLTDNDLGEITVSLNGEELRGWSYKDDAERRMKMFAAREYVEGWCDGVAAPRGLRSAASHPVTDPEQQEGDDCSDPNGHSWVTADEDNGGDGRSYCEHCLADGDA